MRGSKIKLFFSVGKSLVQKPERILLTYPFFQTEKKRGGVEKRISIK
jgi:hypothetical protein